MKIQSKLIGGFGLIAVIALIVSLLGYVYVKNLGSALFEIGVVRLPSITALHMMKEAKITLDGSQHFIASQLNNTVMISKELEEQKYAWSHFDEGMAQYEPLPQTNDEANIWKQFLPASQAWRIDYDSMNSIILKGKKIKDERQLEKAKLKIISSSSTVETLLNDLITINQQVANEAKKRSVESEKDMVLVQRIMLFAGLGGVIVAILFGIFFGRKISKPIVAVADALSNIAQGDLTTTIKIGSNDEIGQMTGAVNSLSETLRTNETQLRTLGDNLPNGMVYQIILKQDGSHQFLYISAGIERLHGLTVEEVLEDSSVLYNQIVAEDLPGFLAAEEESAKSMSVFNVNVRMQRRDGQMRWMNISSTPRILNDKTILWDGIETDITEQKMIESELLQSQEKFSKMFQISKASTSIIRVKDRRYIDVNEAFLAFTEYSRNEVIGKIIDEVNVPGSTKIIQDLGAELRANGFIENKQITYHKKNGQKIFGLLSASYLELGGDLHVLVTTMDITALKNSEEALKTSTEQLHMLAERLQNVREEERKLLSHEVHDELGQVLTAMKMETMTLKEILPINEAKFQRHTNSIILMIDNTIKTVQDISARLRPEMLDYLGLLAAIEWQTEEFQKLSGIVCTLQLPDDQLVIDDERSTVLFRILQETLTNVARHSKAQNVEIILADVNDEFRLTISDDGIGISEQQIRNPKSFGLIGMRERLHSYKGTCIIRAGAQRGTEVIIHLPKKSLERT